MEAGGGGEESQGERACEPRPVPPPCECRTVEGLGSIFVEPGDFSCCVVKKGKLPKERCGLCPPFLGGDVLPASSVLLGTWGHTT